MNKIKIITDSCSDLTTELLKEYDIDYVHMNTVLDGKTSPAVLEWSKENVKKFYNTMREGKRITTTQVPVEEFTNVFKKYLDQGYDIIYLACASRLSGSVNTSYVVANKLKAEYPNNQIVCIDTLTSCIGLGMLAMEASKMVQDGKTVEEIKDHIIAIRNTANQFATVNSLDALKRAGRVKASTAFFGNLFGVKPIIISSAKGDNVAVKKVKGRQNSIKEIINMLKEVIVDSENQTIYLMHADCNDDEVKQTVQLIKGTIPCKDVYVSYIGPIIGASVGPDTIAVYAFGKEVTYTGE